MQLFTIRPSNISLSLTVLCAVVKCFNLVLTKYPVFCRHIQIELGLCVSLKELEFLLLNHLKSYGPILWYVDKAKTHTLQDLQTKLEHFFLKSTSPQVHKPTNFAKQKWLIIRVESCKVLRLRWMHKLEMSHTNQKKKRKILHTGDTEALDRCGE